MPYELIAILMFSTMMVMLFTGQRVFGAIGFVAVIAAVLLWGDRGGYDIGFSAAIKLMRWYPLLTLPMFIFMGYVMSESRIADDLYKMFHVWMGPLNGGLALGTIDAGAMRFSIECFRRGPLQQQIVADEVRRLGGIVELTTPDQFRMEATLTREQLLKIAAMDEVNYIDPWGGFGPFIDPTGFGPLIDPTGGPPDFGPLIDPAGGPSRFGPHIDPFG